MEVAFPRSDDLLLSVTAKILSKNGLFVLQKMAVCFSGTSRPLIHVLFETPGYLIKPRTTVLLGWC